MKYSNLYPFLALTLLSSPVGADFSKSSDHLPPLQIQQPPEGKILGSSLPVSLTGDEQSSENSKVDSKHRSTIINLVRELLGKATNVVLFVNQTHLQVKKLAVESAKDATVEEPIQPYYTISLVLGTPSKTESVPVHVTVRENRGGQEQTADFEYQSATEAEFKTALHNFLTTQLQLATKSGKGKISAEESPVPPQLKAWMTTKDGKAPKVGSQVVIYLTADKKGYVSLYQIDLTRDVQRLFPTAPGQYNFIQANQVYRYPAEGYLEFTQQSSKSQTIKVILTVLPSNTAREQGDGLSFKGEPLQIIPTHYPILFANQDFTRFFALPEHLYTEVDLTYTLESQQ